MHFPFIQWNNSNRSHEGQSFFSRLLLDPAEMELFLAYLASTPTQEGANVMAGYSHFRDAVNSQVMRIAFVRPIISPGCRHSRRRLFK